MKYLGLSYLTCLTFYVGNFSGPEAEEVIISEKFINLEVLLYPIYSIKELIVKRMKTII
jgi:hypothetical protein